MWTGHQEVMESDPWDPGYIWPAISRCWTHHLWSKYGSVTDVSSIKCSHLVSYEPTSKIISAPSKKHKLYIQSTQWQDSSVYFWNMCLMGSFSPNLHCQPPPPPPPKILFMSAIVQKPPKYYHLYIHPHTTSSSVSTHHTE